MISYASSKFPSATSEIKAGIGTPTGHPCVHGLCLQFKLELPPP